MDRKRSILGIISILLIQFASAESGLKDPVTKKTIRFYSISVKEKLNSLNAFHDIDLTVPVIQDNALVSEKIKAYLIALLSDENYKRRFREHTQQSVANYLKYSSYSVGFSEHDKQTIAAQIASLDDLDGRILYFYNNLVCVRITAGYRINKQYDQFGEDAAMHHPIFIDINTGKISELIDLCPKPLQKRFINLLTRERNNVVPTVNAHKSGNDDDDDHEDEKVVYDNEDEDEYFEEKSAPTSKELEEKMKQTQVSLTDLVLDVNAMNFIVMRDANNAVCTKGKPYIIYVNEDSINYYLPFTKNKFKEKFSVKAAPTEINKRLLMYDRTINFLNDQVRESFENITNKRIVSLYYRQVSVTDTTFKLQQKLTYAPDNRLTEIASDYNNDGKQPGTLKKFYYEKGNLKKIEQEKPNKKTTTYAAYYYDKDGYLIRYTSNSANDNRDHSYAFSGMTVDDCSPDNEENDCLTFTFDSIGQLIYYSKKGEIPAYVNVYSKGLLMANGDMLYSYNANNQLETTERDRGRYYTKYFYDKQNRLVMFNQYDGKQMVQKEEYKYDEKGRISFMDHFTYSYGSLSTRIQHMLVYE